MEAVQLLQELSLASEQALAIVRHLPNLVPALSAIAYPGSSALGQLRDRIGRSLPRGGGRGDASRRTEVAVAAGAGAAASKVRAHVCVRVCVI